MNITKLVNEIGCFDLQFRRDAKYNRINQPVYYGWKVQFVIITKIDIGKEDLIRQIQNTLGCGKIHYITGTQLRYSVQDIDSLYNLIVPFFRENPLFGKKKQDFELWAEAIGILYQNKRKPIAGWNKEEFQRLIDIQKTMKKYKVKTPSSFKWLSIAESIAKTL